jgi:hypothetical protein
MIVRCPQNILEAWNTGHGRTTDELLLRAVQLGTQAHVSLPQQPVQSNSPECCKGFRATQVQFPASDPIVKRRIRHRQSRTHRNSSYPQGWRGLRANRPGIEARLLYDGIEILL